MTGANAWLPDLQRSVDNLLLHKLRSLLTMLSLTYLDVGHKPKMHKWLDTVCLRLYDQ